MSPEVVLSVTDIARDCNAEAWLAVLFGVGARGMGGRSRADLGSTDDGDDTGPTGTAGDLRVTLVGLRQRGSTRVVAPDAWMALGGTGTYEL